MEEIRRTSFQGITNIIKFNWHFYVIAFVISLILIISNFFVSEKVILINSVLVLFICSGTIISLAVSYYVYDYSKLYSLDWLRFLNITSNSHLVNIHAGFDETSFLLMNKYSNTNIVVFDFFDPKKHTEVSIERARRVQSIYPNTISIQTSDIPLNHASVDYAFNILSAHEIRDTQERVIYFIELQKCLKQEGRIVVVEHLRDLSNFMAYNFGFFHFFSRKEWLCTFNSAGLSIDKEFKITPFLSVFILQKNGSTT